jgi:sec-independent protein translocase protein TatB
MLNLDPAKLLVIAVVAIILLGPDRLPQLARQAGAAWRSFNEFRHRMESEVRNTMPDLPSTSEIARLARSPTALLNHLSTMSDTPPSTNGDDAGEHPSDGEDSVEDVEGEGEGELSTSADGTVPAPSADGTPSTNGDGAVPASTVDAATVGEPAPAVAAAPDLSPQPAAPAASDTGAPDAEAIAPGESRPGAGPEPRRVPADPGVVAPGDPTLN